VPPPAVPTSRWAARAAATVATLLLAGCSSTVPGTASSAGGPGPTGTSGPTAAPPIDVTPPPSLGVGRVLESHRVAAVTSLVQATFPDRTASCAPTGPFLTPAEVETSYFAEGTAADVLDRYGFVASWGQCGSAPAGPSTRTLVMELSDPEAARRAARELTVAQSINGFRTAQLPGLGVVALLQDQGPDPTEESVRVFVPVGRMLAYAFHEAAPGQGLGEVARLVTDQLALLNGFTPTPQAEVPALPPDPNGLERFAMTPPGTLNNFSGPYDLDGYLRLAIDPIRERDVLLANGFTGFYSKQTDDPDRIYAIALYAFPTSTQTNAVFNAFAELERAAFGGTSFRVRSIPAAPCFVFPTEGTFYQRCYVGYGSYLASVDVGNLPAADDIAEMDRLLPAQRDLIDG
jgi:hypothetical protein